MEDIALIWFCVKDNVESQESEKNHQDDNQDAEVEETANNNVDVEAVNEVQRQRNQVQYNPNYSTVAEE